MDKLHRHLKRVWMGIRRLSGEQRQEKGQSIVLLAVMMIVLLLFAGMALDAGLIYMRRIQLSRAVDAAALACVTELPDMDATVARAAQFMRANGLDTVSTLDYFTVTQTVPEDVPVGVGQDHIATVHARWRSRTVFMQLIGFDYVDLEAEASAEYRAYIDMFASQSGQSGLTGVINLSVFGAAQTPADGDACSCPKRHVSGQSGTYDPRDHDVPDNPNQENAICWSNGYPYRIYVPGSVNQLRIEILDPETYNPPGNNKTIYVLNTCPITNTTVSISKNIGVNWYAPYSYDRYSPSNVNDTDSEGNQPNQGPYDSCPKDPNQFWFAHLDEIWRYYYDTPSSTHTNAYNTTTNFELYYIADGSKTAIATYVGRPDNLSNTDLKWVSPGGQAPQDPQYGAANVELYGFGDYFVTGNPSFEIDMSKLAGIEVADDGSRSLYLDVVSKDGWSENGYDLWAGPVTYTNTQVIPANVNQRNMWILRNGADAHKHGNVVIYGRGILNFNANQNAQLSDPAIITLAWIPEEARGLDVCIYHWDLDVNPQELCYELEGGQLGGTQGSCASGQVEGRFTSDGSWTDTYNHNYEFSPGCDEITIPEYHIGGYLKAYYTMGRQDTSTWLMEYQTPVPGSSYVRLIH